MCLGRSFVLSGERTELTQTEIECTNWRNCSRLPWPCARVRASFCTSLVHLARFIYTKHALSHGACNINPHPICTRRVWTDARAHVEIPFGAIILSCTHAHIRAPLIVRPSARERASVRAHEVHENCIICIVFQTVPTTAHHRHACTIHRLHAFVCHT